MVFWRWFVLSLSVSGVIGWAVFAGVALLPFSLFPLAFPAFPGMTWQWHNVIGIPNVSLSVPSVSQRDLAVA